MNYFKILILSVIFTSPAIGQSLTVGNSFAFWGRTTNTYIIEAEYKLRATLWVKTDTQQDRLGEMTNKMYFGLFYDIFQAKPLTISTGVIAPKFPTKNGAYVNFRIALEVPIKSFSIGYVHYSNGYFYRVNTGLDMLAISYHF